MNCVVDHRTTGGDTRRYDAPPTRNARLDSGFWTGPGGAPGERPYWDFVPYTKSPVALDSELSRIAHLPIWVAWEFDTVINDDGTTRLKKLPLSVNRSGTRGVDMDGCGTMDQAQHYFRTETRAQGIGVRFDEQYCLGTLDFDLKNIAPDDPDRALVEGLAAKYGLHSHYSPTERGGGFHTMGYVSASEIELIETVGGMRTQLLPLGKRAGFVDIFHGSQWVTVTERTKIAGPLENIAPFIRDIIAIHNTRVPTPLNAKRNFGQWDIFIATDKRTPQDVLSFFARHKDQRKIVALFANDEQAIGNITGPGNPDFPAYRRYSAWHRLCSMFTRPELPPHIVVCDPDLLLRILRLSRMTSNGKHLELRKYKGDIDRYLSDVIKNVLSRDMPGIIRQRELYPKMIENGKTLAESMFGIDTT